MSVIEKFLIIIFFVIAYGGLIKSILNISASIAAKKWLRIRVKINRSEVEAEYDVDCDSFVTKVNYSYQYKGHNYTSNKIAYGYRSHHFERIALAYSAKFSQDSIANAYVNPKYPQRSVLIAGLKYFHLLQFSFWVIFTAILHFTNQ